MWFYRLTHDKIPGDNDIAEPLVTARVKVTLLSKTKVIRQLVSIKAQTSPPSSPVWGQSRYNYMFCGHAQCLGFTLYYTIVSSQLSLMLINIILYLINTCQRRPLVSIIFGNSKKDTVTVKCYNNRFWKFLIFFSFKTWRHDNVVHQQFVIDLNSLKSH
jgi:hypothetical protein